MRGLILRLMTVGEKKHTNYMRRHSTEDSPAVQEELEPQLAVILLVITSLCSLPLGTSSSGWSIIVFCGLSEPSCTCR